MRLLWGHLQGNRRDDGLDEVQSGATDWLVVAMDEPNSNDRRTNHGGIGTGR